VFSAPEQFEEWLTDHGLDAGELEGCITYAGDVVPGFSADEGNAEVFVHAPFADHFDPSGADMNGSSLVLHVTFFPAGSGVRLMLGSDAEYGVWQDVVGVSEANENETRLDWDIFKVAHHCSYSALAGEAGMGQTVPIDEVKRLFERGVSGGILVASCNPINCDATPPHPEAAAYYAAVTASIDGEWLVTMEYPDEESPKPIVIHIGEDGVSVDRASKRWSGAAAVVGASSPRFGV
jgi:hypothetical protein